VNPTYPHRRGSLFGWDFLKIVQQSGAVKQIGATGVCLLTAVAIKEHALDYLSPPDFWNSQLKEATGITDDDAFNACRQRCVKSGWLAYQRGPAPRSCGVYWVTVPKGLDGLISIRRFNRHNTPDKTPGSAPGKAPVNTPRKAPVNTPDLPLPLPSHSLPGGEGNPAPAGKTEDAAANNTKRLQRHLRQLGLPASKDAAIEWADFLTGPLVRCKTTAEVIDLLAWTVSKLRERETKIEYAKHAAPIAGQIRAELAKYRKAGAP